LGSVSDAISSSPFGVGLTSSAFISFPYLKMIRHANEGVNFAYNEPFRFPMGNKRL
jgi:hypothetical protein